MALAGLVRAEPPELSLPIDCTLGQNCYIEDYVDADAGFGQTNYRCGLKSREGHKGTDFVLRDFTEMQAGVDVLAAAPGVVAATRDGMPDHPVSGAARAAIEGRECGNAVRIDHGGGWQTLYCHMAQGSIEVQNGEYVSRGDVLGQIGLSGLTNIPHVHFGILKHGKPIDPFRPLPTQSCEEEPNGGLWLTPPDYHRAGLFTVGFSTSLPSFEDVQSGAARKKTGAADSAIVLYAYAFHPMAGDTLTLSAKGPTGEIFRKTITIETPQAHLFRAFGKRSPGSGWPKGAYRGTVLMQRNGTLLAARHADFLISR